MNDRILLTKLKIQNFGPIKEDEVIFNNFTFFVGRNNAGKSHYLKAIEILLASKMPKKEEMTLLQNDKTKEIILEGHFIGVENFTKLASTSNHKEAIEREIINGVLRVVRILDPNDEEKTNFGIYKNDGSIYNPRGFPTNLLEILPDFISILATADTIDELKNYQNTALGKLKKEALTAFLEELRIKTKEALITIDSFLHGEIEGQRSKELVDFENKLKEELMGEFSEVIPSIEFGLPNEKVIADAMKILLDDGYKTEVEQKGHGLQRATLLALLKLLARSGQRYTDHPPPIFLIGELESFLHPYAQRQMANALIQMMERYQIVTTTHSPFIITPTSIEGYRRVRKSNDDGSKNITLNTSSVDVDLIKRHLERRGNLEGLFADRIIVIEGDHDENFYQRLMNIFKLSFPQHKLTLFVKADGKKQARIARKFYSQMCFDDIAVICDLDYLFCCDIEHLLEELGLDKELPSKFRKHIGYTVKGDPKLDYIMAKINEKGEPERMEALLHDLQKNRIFVLRHGAPEMYYKNHPGEKKGWLELNSEFDLLEAEYLKELMKLILE